MGMEDTILEAGEDASYIKRIPFQVVTSVFFAIASISVVGRIAWKLWHRGSLHLHDYILFFSVASLAGSTTTIHLGLVDVYTQLAASSKSTWIDDGGSSFQSNTASKSVLYLDIFQCLSWTAIFLAKFAFLAFLRESVAKMYKMKMLYLAAVMSSGVCWAFVIAAPFIACPYLGAQAAQCSSPARDHLYRILFGVTTALDCLTTVLVISIPVILLDRTQSALHQKLAIGTIVFLSLGMIVTSVMRSARPMSHLDNARDTPFQTYLLYLESCLAITMVCLASCQNLLCLQRAQKPRPSRSKWPPASLWDRRPGSEEHLTGGIRTFVRRGSRPKCELARAESVLRTREVVVEVHYQGPSSKELWVGSPDWMNDGRIKENNEKDTRV